MQTPERNVRSRRSSTQAHDHRQPGKERHEALYCKCDVSSGGTRYLASPADGPCPYTLYSVISSFGAPGSMSSIELPSSTPPTHDAPEVTHTPLGTTAESGASTPQIESETKKSNMIIAAAAVGGLGLFFALGFGVYWLFRRRRSRTPPSAAFRARMARADFVMVTGEHGHNSPSYSV